MDTIRELIENNPELKEQIIASAKEHIAKNGMQEIKDFIIQYEEDNDIDQAIVLTLNELKNRIMEKLRTQMEKKGVINTRDLPFVIKECLKDIADNINRLLVETAMHQKQHMEECEHCKHLSN